MDIRQGDCLDLLKTLSPQSIQTIYLDPPFNSDRTYTLSAAGGPGFEDHWTDETYREFVKTVIDLCVPLLKPNGSLFFHISSEQMFIPESILRAAFSIVKPIVWKRCRSKNNFKNNLGSSIDMIFWCTQTPKRKFHMVYQPLDSHYLNNSFKNSDARGHYSLGHLVCDKTRTGYDYEFTIEGKMFHPSKGWRISKEEMEKLQGENRLYVPKGKKANLYKKLYKDESPGKPCLDIWDDIFSIAQGSEIRHYPTAKPLKLLERIVDMTTDEGDTVLDPMAGSGTMGEACKLKNRLAVLFDRNPEAIAIIRERLISPETVGT